MKFQTSSNIIPLFTGVVQAIRPYAESNQVNLKFEPEINKLVVDYHPEEIIRDLTILLCNVISFTPMTFTVELSLCRVIEGKTHNLIIELRNNGANLSRLSEITSGLKNKVSVLPIENNGTVFKLKIPFKPGNNPNEHHSPLKIKNHGIPQYYAEIRKRLRSHFANIENLERAAALKSHTKGIFLQKLNALILTNLSNEDFNTDCLCKGMALSRTQLYRKLKTLTHLPPAQYIQFVRLQKAKEFLQNTNMNVGEVVLKVGFASHSHFTRAFHDQFGINPSFLKKET
ncbi:MAG: helix-turn-helix transcriptional regulator [Bacteroidetes bacterium]|nr:helix-turn-helix transcriptional regulator [Bacteroidota bacterium]